MNDPFAPPSRWMYPQWSALVLCALVCLTAAVPAVAAVPEWRQEAEARIEAIRKGDFTLRLQSEDGQPVDAKVRVQMHQHAFPFGSVVRTALIAPSSPYFNPTYAENYFRFFNAGGAENAVKWGPWEGEHDPERFAHILPGGDNPFLTRQWVLDYFRLAKLHGHHVRGHVLHWSNTFRMPMRLKHRDPLPDPERVWEEIRAHITSIAEEAGPYVDEWDTLNEPFRNRKMMTALGDAFMVDLYQFADRQMPEADLYINEYDILTTVQRPDQHRHQAEGYYRTIQYLLDNGAPLDGIGVQCHFDYRPDRTMERLKEELDRLGAFGLPVKITEYDLRPRNKQALDEATRARYLDDFLTLCFSHPAVAGFQFWGFWDGAHWLSYAGLFRKDWTLRPEGEVFYQRVHRDWSTDLQVNIDDGLARFRAFYGTYDITVNDEHGSFVRRVELSAETPEIVLTVPPLWLERR